MVCLFVYADSGSYIVLLGLLRHSDTRLFPLRAGMTQLKSVADSAGDDIVDPDEEHMPLYFEGILCLRHERRVLYV